MIFTEEGASDHHVEDAEHHLLARDRNDVAVADRDHRHVREVEGGDVLRDPALVVRGEPLQPGLGGGLGGDLVVVDRDPHAREHVVDDEDQEEQLDQTDEVSQLRAEQPPAGRREDIRE